MEDREEKREMGGSYKEIGQVKNDRGRLSERKRVKQDQRKRRVDRRRAIL